jgi:RNA 3'-phosphate cyclase
MKDMLHIDGSQGEGGGQVLRTALTMSVMTGKPFSMTNIRARRSKPGLMAQHLKAVEAAAAISGAKVTNLAIGSSSLKFEPQGLYAGEYHIDIGTAGSTSLVLQTVFVPLSFGQHTSWLSVVGGTHVPWSPCHHFLSRHWLRYMKKAGYNAQFRLDIAGFYPAGGGRVTAEIRPVKELHSLRINERGELRTILGISAFANLDISIAERQRQQAERKLAQRGFSAEIEILRMSSRFKNTMLMLLAEFKHSRCCYYALGARGKSAERVADEAVEAFGEFLATKGAVDQYVTDQLILPLVFAKGESVLHTCKVTQHLLTMVDIIRMFRDVNIQVDGKVGEEGTIRIMF